MLFEQHLEPIRRGRLRYLRYYIHGSVRKIYVGLEALRQWALANGLKPSETGTEA